MEPNTRNYSNLAITKECNAINGDCNNGGCESVYAVNITSNQKFCVFEIEVYATFNTVKWTAWGEWSDCEPNGCIDKAGSRNRHRICQNAWGSLNCPGEGIQQKPCSLQACLDDGKVQLTWNGKKRLNHGLVEIRHEGKWGTICDDSTNVTRVGKIACLEVGYNDCVFPDMGGSGQIGPGKTWLDEMDCNATDTKLTDCHHHPWGKHNCNKDENIVIKCANRIPVAGVSYNLHLKTFASQIILYLNTIL